MVYLSFVWVFHQPTIQHKKILRELHEEVYMPFLKVLEDLNKDIKPSFVVTGSFIDAYFTEHSELIEYLKDLIVSLEASVLPTLYYYPIPTEISQESFKKHLELHVNIMNSLFKRCSGIFFPPYIIWTPKYSPLLKSMGIVGTLININSIISKKVPVLIPWKGVKIVGLPVSMDISKRVPWYIDALVEYLKSLEETPNEQLVIIVKNVENVFVAGGKESSLKILEDMFSRILSLDNVKLINVDNVFKVYRKASEIPATYSCPEDFLKLTGELGSLALIKSCASKALYYRMKIVQQLMERADVKSLLELEEMHVLTRGRTNPYYKYKYVSKFSKKYSKFVVPYGVRILEHQIAGEPIILYETRGLSSIINSYGYIISLLDLLNHFDYVATALPENIELSMNMIEDEFRALPPHAFLEFIGENVQIPSAHSIEINTKRSEGIIEIRYSTRSAYVEKTYRIGSNTLTVSYHVKKNPYINDPLSVRFLLMLPVSDIGNTESHRMIIGYSEKDYEILETRKISGAWSNYKWIGLVDCDSGLGVYFWVDSINGTYVSVSLGKKGHDIRIFPELSNTSYYKFEITIGVGKLIQTSSSASSQ